MERVEIAVEALKQEQKKVRKQYRQFSKVSSQFPAMIFQLCEEAPQKQDKGQRRQQ